MRKKRQQKTKQFATAKRLNGGKWDWKYKLVRFGEKLFGHRPSQRVPYPDEEQEPIKLRDLEGGLKRSSTYNTERFLGAYEERRHQHDDHRSVSSKPSTLPSLKDNRSREERLREKDRHAAPSLMSGPSLYSQITGNARRTPETREPVRKNEDLLIDSESRTGSRLSDASFGSSYYFRPTPISEAEAYKEAVRPILTGSTSYWLEPVKTGSSGKSNSRNPFNRI